MKIGLYPFASTASIEDNLQIMDKAAATAAAASIRLLVFHECALCGYPPIESKMQDIHPNSINYAVSHLAETAKRQGLFLAFGTMRFERDKRYNSILLIGDQGKLTGYYDKQALWGWDTDHFTRGNAPGLFEIDGFRIGFRICYDIRFPELFRQLRKQNADLCIVCFSDTAEKANPERYQIIKSHLVTRAVENTMAIASVNSISGYQTAPTAVIDPRGMVTVEAMPNQEQLVVFDYTIPMPDFSMEGIRKNTAYFIENNPE